MNLLHIDDLTGPGYLWSYDGVSSALAAAIPPTFDPIISSFASDPFNNLYFILYQSFTLWKYNGGSLVQLCNQYQPIFSP